MSGFLKINDDFLTNSDTKHYSRFNITWVLIYKRKRIETNVTETNVTKCYGHDQTYGRGGKGQTELRSVKSKFLSASTAR